MKVSEKGGVSVYGLGRFPITLYQEQWLKLLDMTAEIRAFIKANRGQTQGEGVIQAGVTPQSRGRSIVLRVNRRSVTMLPERIALLVAVLGSVTAAPGMAQKSPVARGAVIGGVIGGTAGGLFGAALGRGLCDAADCSGAWVDGAAIGVVLGGLSGALLGAGAGALVGGDQPGSGAGHRLRPAAMVEVTASRAESNSIHQGTQGIRLMAGGRAGGLMFGPMAERVSGAGWRVTDLGVMARLDPGTGIFRPFAELSAGHYGWRYPGVIPTCEPGLPPNCTYRQGTITDGYLGAAGAVGLSLGPPGDRWAVHAEIRYHHSGNRATGETGSTTTRQLRQVSVGMSLAFGSK